MKEQEKKEGEVPPQMPEYKQNQSEFAEENSTLRSAITMFYCGENSDWYKDSIQPSYQSDPGIYKWHNSLNAS